MMPNMSRRGLLRVLGLSLLAMISGTERLLRAATKPPAEVPLAQRLEEVLKGRRPQAGGLKLDIPTVAEDGSVVPTTLHFGELMQSTGHLQKVSLIVDNNPDPLILTIPTPSPHLGGSLFTRIRMRKSSRVALYAETKDGKLYVAEKNVQVTAGGCS